MVEDILQRLDPGIPGEPFGTQLKDRNQRTQDPFRAHSHQSLEREVSGTGRRVFVPAILDRLCRLTSMQIGATGPRTQSTKDTLGEHRALGRISGSRNVWFLQY